VVEQRDTTGLPSNLLDQHPHSKTHLLVHYHLLESPLFGR
jgi:hypothetical protein